MAAALTGKLRRRIRVTRRQVMVRAISGVRLPISPLQGIDWVGGGFAAVLFVPTSPVEWVALAVADGQDFPFLAGQLFPIEVRVGKTVEQPAANVCTDYTPPRGELRESVEGALRFVQKRRAKAGSACLVVLRGDN
jgi:hypothetical protein